MKEDNNNIIYSAADIEKYHQGVLSASDMHAMEKAALDDPFLADAMEGYEQPAAVTAAAGDTLINHDVNDLRTRLQNRIEKKSTAPVIAFAWWKVAAAVFLFAGAAWIYVGINNKTKVQSIVKNDIAQERQKLVMTHSDSTAKTPPAASRDPVVAKQYPKSAEGITKPGLTQPETKTAATITAAAPAASKQLQKETEKPANLREKDDYARTESLKKKNAAPKSTIEVSPQKVEAFATEDQNSAGTVLAGRATNLRSTFDGTVLDQSNTPMANATVQIPNLNISTTTNKKGFFSFKAPDSALRVMVASSGYETQNIDLSNNSIENTNNIIRLKPTLLNVKDMAASGAIAKNSKDARKKNRAVIISILGAEPTITWIEYNQYLRKNKKITEELKDIHGEVLVSFIVDSKNRLGGFNIETSLTEEANEEAIRLIREGPEWKLLTGKKAKVLVTVKF